MKHIKSYKFNEILKKELKNKTFKKEYENLEDEFLLAKEVMVLRKNNNMTQLDLAKLSGTSQPAIARLESGNYRNISLSFLKRIGKALGAEPVIHLRKIAR